MSTSSGGFGRGASFAQQNKKLLASMTFPKCFEQKVDLRKVKREVINQWITERVTQLLGFEDDIVVSMIINLLEPKVDERVDPRQLQLAVTGFLEKDAPRFTEELWGLLLSAQAHPTGIPTQLLEQKKAELARAAESKARLREVLSDRKADDANSQPRGPRAATSGPREAPREPRSRSRRDDDDRLAQRQRHRPRSRSRSGSRNRSHSRSRSRSGNRSQRRGRRRPASRSPSRSRSRGRGRRRPRSLSRSPSPQRRRSHRRRSSSSPNDRTRSRGDGKSHSTRSRSPSSPSLDRFGRQRR